MTDEDPPPAERFRRKGEIAIVRESEDLIAESRISLGQVRDGESFYIVFRGDPEKVLKLMRNALLMAEYALPNGKYMDNRPFHERHKSP